MTTLTFFSPIPINYNEDRDLIDWLAVHLLLKWTHILTIMCFLIILMCWLIGLVTCGMWKWVQTSWPNMMECSHFWLHTTCNYDASSECFWILIVCPQFFLEFSSNFYPLFGLQFFPLHVMDMIKSNILGWKSSWEGILINVSKLYSSI